jgi:hypothetical protein
MATAFVLVALLAGGCGGDDEGGTAGSTTGAAAGPEASTTTSGGGQRVGAARSGASSGGGRGGAENGAHARGDTAQRSRRGAASADAASGGGASGGSGGAGSADQGAPTAEAAIKAVLTDAGSPGQACGSYVTERFLLRAFGGRANCLAARRPNALARTIAIKRAFVDEQGAHAVVVPTGGPYDGARVEIEVVARGVSGGGPYLLDSLKAHVPAGP